jgi:hypothetical protein
MSDESENAQPHHRRANPLVTLCWWIYAIGLSLTLWNGCLSSSFFRTYLDNLKSTAWGGIIIPVYPLSFLIYILTFIFLDTQALHSQGKDKRKWLLLLGPPPGILILFAVTYFLSKN